MVSVAPKHSGEYRNDIGQLKANCLSRKALNFNIAINDNSLELSCIKEVSQSILARHPKEALWLVIGRKR